MKNLLLIAALACFAGCEDLKQVTSFRGASSTPSASSKSLAPSKWSASKLPLKVEISTDFSGVEDQAIRDMANAWSDSIDDNIVFMDAAYSTPEKNSVELSVYEDNVIGVYKMTQWPEVLPLSALAVTQLIGSRRNAGADNEYIEIQHADILINYEMYGFSTTTVWDYDLKTIVLHEMGHLLGLYHDDSSVDDSVMYPSITRSVQNRYPKERDIQAIENLYGVSRSSGHYRLAYRPRQENAQDRSPASEEENKVVLRYELKADGCDQHRL